ncbi:M23 family metallopeptidase [Nonomuraea sp. NPDC050536]|uniref:M23 family metallopeptidase n=1 Tax=Nonomuraea sp. NPDC050536 TaxID=3364366 RepID=UPI0037C857AA
MRLIGATILTLLLSLGSATAAYADPQPDPTADSATSDSAETLAAPAFQMPFPCGQTWTGDSDDSSAHQSWEIDWNRGSTPDADLGDPVVAAAGGTVVIATNQGSVNGYGNLIKIDHGGGWTSYYAHLQTMRVSIGQTVSQGQLIGNVGNTSKPGNNISPHLHYEVRLGTNYPANIQKAVFDGVTYGYPDQTLTSHNCGNPYSPEQVCGTGYKVIDSAALGSDGAVYLLYNSGNGNNCVTTLKSKSLGTATATTAYLEPQGGSRVTDSGNFGYYAGPVYVNAPGKCVKWGGKAGASSYDSPFEHCG